MDFIQYIQWRPQIGDPTVMGWVTVSAYAGAAITALITSFRCGQSRRLWLVVGILMGLLCINKQLDLQSLLTDIGRVIAWKQGWYQDRREFQKWFVVGIVGISGVSAALVAWRFREFWKRQFILAVGLTFLVMFIVVRAVSFHHVDVLLKTELAGVRMNWLLELTGIGLVWLAALLACFHGARMRKVSEWVPS